MISLLCPTRRRPANLRRLYDSIQATATRDYPIELFCYVDEDDEQTIAEANLIPGVRYEIGPRLLLGDYWNALAAKATYEIVMMSADDMVFRTPGWDMYVTNAFA